MKKTILLAVISGLLVAVAWWLFHAHNFRQENMVRFESAMTEGLLQGIIKEGDAETPRYYFVAFGEERTDPSRLFIAQFASHVPPVRVGSSAFMLRNGQWQETASGQAGVIVQILRVKNIKAGIGEAVVVFPNLAADQNRFKYRMIEQAGHWSIKYKLPTR